VSSTIPGRRPAGLVALTRRTRPAHAAEFGIPWLVRMVLAHPAEAFANRTVRIAEFDRPLNELARSSLSLVMFDFGDERRFDPGGLGTPDRLRQLRFGADDGVESLPDPARTGAPCRRRSGRALPFWQVAARPPPVGPFTKPTTRNLARCRHLTLTHASLRSDR
jgi:hypothetical protein